VAIVSCGEFDPVCSPPAIGQVREFTGARATRHGCAISRNSRSGRAAFDVRRERSRQGAKRLRAGEAARACRRLWRLRARAGGAPGVHSAYYAGAPRTTRGTMRSWSRRLPGSRDRRAHYACVLTLLRHEHDPEPDHRGRDVARDDRRRATRHGRASATTRISSRCRDWHDRRRAPLERKNELSHRGKAMRALIARLRGEGSEPRGTSMAPQR
jgi:hypothetical protein